MIMVTLKYGKDIVEGDVLMTTEGTTVPFAIPTQPAIVVDRWMNDPGRYRLTTKKYPHAKDKQEYVIWSGEMYFVWNGTLPEYKGKGK